MDTTNISNIWLNVKGNNMIFSYKLWHYIFVNNAVYQRALY